MQNLPSTEVPSKKIGHKSRYCNTRYQRCFRTVFGVALVNVFLASHPNRQKSGLQSLPLRLQLKPEELK